MASYDATAPTPHGLGPAAPLLVALSFGHSAIFYYTTAVTTRAARWKQAGRPLQGTGRAVFPYLRKRVNDESGADNGAASILGESSSNPASLADPFSSQPAGTPPSELNVSRSSTGDTMHDSSHTQAAATTSSASSPWVRSEAPTSNQVDGSQALITPGLLNQEVPAAPSVPAGSPALPPVAPRSAPVSSESFPMQQSIVQRFAVGRRGVTTSGTVPDATNATTRPLQDNVTLPSTAPTPVPTPPAPTPPSDPTPPARSPVRRSARLSSVADVDYSGMLTSGGDLDAPALLFDLKTSASSNERILMSGEQVMIMPHGRLAQWMLNTMMESNVRSLDQLTKNEIMYVSNSDNFVTDYREHGFSRAIKYGHGCDPNESVLDALFMQYLTAEDKSQAEIVLVVENTTKLEHSIEEHRLMDLKTVPVDQHPHMIAAAAKEIGDLIKIGTFSLAEIPINRKAIDSRIVFKVKHRADGTFDKFKARLVAKGFMQRLGFDFFSTFSPMATLTTVRTVFAIAVRLGLPIYHADIPQAFVTAKLSEDVWLRLPPGIHINRDGKQHRVVKLLRALYGLRQSPQQFNKELVKFLVGGIDDLHFTQASADSCLFYYVNPITKKFVLVASEVDDLIIVGTDTEGVEKLKAGLVERFNIDDTKWEGLSSFLGINIHYDLRAGRLEMDVEQKVEKLLAEHPLLHNIRMHDVPASDSASEVPESAASKYTETDVYIKNNYASIIGSCIYMSITVRNDITFAVGKCARGMHNPQPKHVAMLKQLVGYLKKTKGYKLVYCQYGNPAETLFKDISNTDGALAFIASSDGKNVQELIGLADANFANITDEERKSISGLCFYVFGCPVSWRSKLQTITAGSTHEAELIAIALAANEGVWIRKLLLEIGFAVGLAPALSRPDVDQKTGTFLEDDDSSESESSSSGYWMKPFPLFNDNLGATQTVNNPDTSWRTRHLDVKYFKVRDYIKQMKLTVSHVPTTLNVADYFTKALTYRDFNKFRQYLSVCPG